MSHIPRSVGVLRVTEDETAYYLRRAAEELAKAEQSSCPQAADAHRELHRRYVAIVEQDSGKVTTERPVSAEAAGE